VRVQKDILIFVFSKKKHATFQLCGILASKCTIVSSVFSRKKYYIFIRIFATKYHSFMARLAGSAALGVFQPTAWSSHLLLPGVPQQR